jgi:hypothetical protein
MGAGGPTWDLEVLLPGGVRGEAFVREVEGCRERLRALLAAVARLDPLPADLPSWREVIAGTLATWERAGSATRCGSALCPRARCCCGWAGTTAAG